MAGDVAPVALAGAAADGADLDIICRAGGQAIERQRAGIGVQAAILPWAGCAISADHGIPKFVALGVGNGLAELYQQLAGIAVEKAEDEGRGQMCLDAAGAGGRESAGE